MTSTRLICCAALVLACASCGHTGKDTWLLRSDGSTMTVGEAGEAWLALELRAQEEFSASGNPLGDFVVALGRKMLVEQEMRDLGYLERPDIRTLAIASARTSMFRAMQDSIMARSSREVTREEIDSFLHDMSWTVWFTETSRTGVQTSFGPSYLSLLGPEAAGILADLSPGESATGPVGTVLRLDSIAPTDPVFLADIMADTEAVETYAREKLAQLRAVEVLRGYQEEALTLFDGTYDAGAVSAYARSRTGIPAEISPDVVMSIRGEGWDAARLSAEIVFESTLRMTSPSDTTWLHDLGRAIVYRSLMAEEFRRMSPAVADSLEEQARLFMMAAAADSLYNDFVNDSIEVTTALLDSAYAADPPSIPERRSVECIILRNEVDLAAFRRAIVHGEASDLARQSEVCPGLAPEGERISWPRTVDEMPTVLGETIFALQPADTNTWSDPAPWFGENDGECFVSARLAGVVPAHTASREEAAPILEPQVRASLAEARLTAWLLELERRHDLEINEKALGELPDDPALWVTL